jgi:hypothetical protein
MSTPDLSEEQAYWLHRVLVTRPKDGPLDNFTIPDSIHDELVAHGLIRWRRGTVEITLDGIREIARYHRVRDAAEAVRET